jgi:hypothetical protein
LYIGIDNIELYTPVFRPPRELYSFYWTDTVEAEAVTRVIYTAALVFAAALPLGAQDGSQALLDRLRAHMTDVLKQQPNFTCLETVERAVRGVREDAFRVLDTLRLEVALVDRKEMFAFPGSKEFDDNGLRTFVPTGMFGNGYFGLFAAAALEYERTEMVFRGESQQGQRSTLQYDFHVPVESGMEIHSMDATATVGYRGSLSADAATLDVLKLDVVAENMPVRLGLRQATATVEFARVRIGDREVLLPSVGELVMVTWMGDTTRNRTRFSECREFTGKSTVAFGGGLSNAVPEAKGTAAKQELQIPRNLSVTLRLVDETDTDDMAIGDQVRAALDADLKADGKLLLPKGAAVLGRLVRLMHVGNYTVLGLIFQEAESETAHAALELNFQRATGADLMNPGSRLKLASPPKPHEAVIGLGPGHHILSRSILLYWRT